MDLLCFTASRCIYNLTPEILWWQQFDWQVISVDMRSYARPRACNSQWAIIWKSGLYWDRRFRIILNTFPAIETRLSSHFTVLDTLITHYTNEQWSRGFSHNAKQRLNIDLQTNTSGPAKLFSNPDELSYCSWNLNVCFRSFRSIYCIIFSSTNCSSKWRMHFFFVVVLFLLHLPSPSLVLSRDKT